MRTDTRNILSIGTVTNYDLGFNVQRFSKNLMPEITENTQSIPAKVGVGYLQNSYGALELTADCIIIADSSEDMFSTFRDISNALWSDRGNEKEQPISWSGDTEDGELIVYYGHVSSVSTPSWVDENSYRAATFTITFKCSNPYGYGERRTIRPLGRYNGDFAKCKDFSEAKYVGADNYLLDTYVNVTNPDMTQRDYGTDDYQYNVPPCTFEVDQTIVDELNQGKTARLSFDCEVLDGQTTKMISSDSRSRNGEDVSDTIENYSGTVDGVVMMSMTVFYTDGTQEVVVASKPVELLATTTKVSQTFKASKTVQSVSTTSFYINTYGERISFENPQLQIANDVTQATFTFNWRASVASPFAVIIWGVGRYPIEPESGETNEFDEYVGTYTTTVTLPTSGAPAINLENDVETQIEISDLKLHVINDDDTYSNMIASPEDIEHTAFIFTQTDDNQLTLDVKGTGVTHPVISMLAKDKQTYVGYDVQSGGNEYNYIGVDVNSETGEVTTNGTSHKYENIFHDECNNLQAWKGVGKSNLSWNLDGEPSGRLASNGTGLQMAYTTYTKRNSLGKATGTGTRKNFGSAENKKSYYGPVIKQYLTTSLTDFRVRIRWTFHVHHAFARGKEDFYLLDTNGNRHMLLQLIDNDNSGAVHAKIIAGDGSNKKTLVDHVGSKKGSSKTVTTPVYYYDGSTHKEKNPQKVKYSAKKIAAYKKQIAKIRKTKKPTKAQKKKLAELLKLQKAGWTYKKTSNITVGTQHEKKVAEKNLESTYSNCYCEMTLERKGTTYSWQIAILDPKTHKTKSKKTGRYVDRSNDFSSWNLGQVAYFAAKKNVSPYDNWSTKYKDTVRHYAEDFVALYDVRVDQIVQAVDPTPVVSKNDELVFNCEDHKIYKNAVTYMDKMAIGAQFTQIVPGEPTTLAFTPDFTTASWVIYYKPRYK